jgi:hypothetical protein
MNHNSQLFDVWITPYALTKLNYYATEAQPNEIGGLARLEIDGHDVFVNDVYMFPQKASAATFEIEAKDINSFVQQLVSDGRLDEVSQWCSIVHSHPIGMSPSMSSVDVDAIKRFAAEEDAFSLIISSSAKADSTKLAMHYCTNVRGQKFIVSDMPVRVCHSQERVDLGSELADWLIERLNNDDDTPILTDGDRKDLLEKCISFTADTLPELFEEELNVLVKFVKEDTKKLISKKYSYTSNNFGFGSGLNAHDSKLLGNGQMDIYSGSYYDHANYYDDSWYDRYKKDEKHDDLVKLSNGIDPVTGKRNVSKNRQKKAKKQLVKIAARERNKKLSRVSQGFRVGQFVMVEDEESIKMVRDQCVTDKEVSMVETLLMVPGKVEHVNGDLITVNGIDFWSDELRPATVQEIEMVEEVVIV